MCISYCLIELLMYCIPTTRGHCWWPDSITATRGPSFTIQGVPHRAGVGQRGHCAIGGGLTGSSGYSRLALTQHCKQRVRLSRHYSSPHSQFVWMFLYIQTLLIFQIHFATSGFYSFLDKFRPLIDNFSHLQSRNFFKTWVSEHQTVRILNFWSTLCIEAIKRMGIWLWIGRC